MRRTRKRRSVEDYLKQQQRLRVLRAKYGPDPNKPRGWEPEVPNTKRRPFRAWNFSG
jgi:hypothetical protein